VGAQRGKIMATRVTRLAMAAALMVTLVAGCGTDDDRASSPTTGSAPIEADANPPPPSIPDDFQWTGRYIVPDLDLEVPFTWSGDGGNMQMIAGSDDELIHFTNLIYDGHLYTLTYKWPGVPRNPCSDVGPYTLSDLNTGLASSRFVGPETINDPEPREVNHFRAGVVWEPPPEIIPPIEGVPQIRIPLMSGDIYVDRSDPTTFWQVLQFGLQNLYDANLDEWIVIDQSETTAGTVTLPEECASAQAGTPPVPDPPTTG
jgi:hypothetical protein